LRAESVDELRARGVVALTKTQMAAALQVSYRTVGEMMRREEIPFFRIGGKHVRFRVEEALKRMEGPLAREIRSAKSEVRGQQAES
jgi:excisionase family DNA binding protein